MAALNSILVQACDEVRSLVGEPNNTSKLANADILRKIPGVFQSVLSEINGMASDPLCTSIDYTLGSYALDDNLLLPAMARTIRAVVAVDASGNVIGQFRKLNPYDQRTPRYGYEMRGPYLHVIVPDGFSATYTTARVIYEPTGYMPVHYGTIDATSGTAIDQSAGLWVNLASATVTSGQTDSRPNGYVGAWFRIYATSSAPTGYSSTTDNIDERLIVSFTPTNKRIVPESALTFAPLAAKGGTWSYEIVPTQDWSFFRAITHRMAREISGAWGRTMRYSTINKEYQAIIRDATYLTANGDIASPGSFFCAPTIDWRYIL